MWENEEYLVFKQKEYKPLALLPDHDVISSLFELSHEVKTWRNIGIGFAISFFALTLTLLSFGANVFRQVSDLRTGLDESKQARQQADKDTRILRDRIDALEDQIKVVESMVAKQ